MLASALAAGRMAVVGAALHAPAYGATDTRRIASFDAVVLSLPAQVSIEQGPRETLTLDAEPAILRTITAEVHGRQLLIGIAPGRIETQQPIRIKLGVRALRSFESRAASAISIGPLRSDALALVLAGGSSIHLDRLDGARTLDVRIMGAGDVDIRGGKVSAQRLVINGSGRYFAFELASERAEVAIDGNGEVQLAASSALDVRIGGVGIVRYRGSPAVTRAIRGIGSIEKH